LEKALYVENRLRPTARVKMPVSSFGYVLGLRELMFAVVEARIEARLSKIETRVSSIKLLDSIRASSPLNVKLSDETGFVAVAVNKIVGVFSSFEGNVTVMKQYQKKDDTCNLWA
jgi:hypothetical protein